MEETRGDENLDPSPHTWLCGLSHNSDQCQRAGVSVTTVYLCSDGQSRAMELWSEFGTEKKD